LIKNKSLLFSFTKTKITFLYFCLASNELDPIPDFRTRERKVRPLQPVGKCLLMLKIDF